MAGRAHLSPATRPSAAFWSVNHGDGDSELLNNRSIYGELHLIGVESYVLFRTELCISFFLPGLGCSICWRCWHKNWLEGVARGVCHAGWKRTAS